MKQFAACWWSAELH